jgi:hypothetical protein
MIGINIERVETQSVHIIREQKTQRVYVLLIVLKTMCICFTNVLKTTSIH